MTTYVRYGEDTTINEDMLFCKHIKRRATVKEILKTDDDLKKEKTIQWSDFAGICMDAACIMTENKEGPQTLIK
jgi:hypothetical protein